MKIDDAFNFGLYNQLCATLKYRDYELRCARSGFITNIGSYDRQYPYTETKYSDFDKFLFSSWKNKPNRIEKIRFSGVYQLIKESNIFLAPTQCYT